MVKIDVTKRKREFITWLYTTNCDGYRSHIQTTNYILTQQVLQDIIQIMEYPETPLKQFRRSRTIWNHYPDWVRHVIMENIRDLMNPKCTQLKYNYDKLTSILFTKPYSTRDDASIKITTKVPDIFYGYPELNILPKYNYTLQVPN